MQSTYNSGQYLENAPEVLAIITITVPTPAYRRHLAS